VNSRPGRDAGRRSCYRGGREPSFVVPSGDFVGNR
jgi:hypothetical protein